VRITIIGAGVIGLTTAVELERRGHDVEVIAAHHGDATTSAVAGAIWFPYRAGESTRVLDWAHRTRLALTGLATDPATGVDVLPFYECAGDEARPWWAGDLELERVPAPVRGAPEAWRFAAPRVEPAAFLAWLAGRLRRAPRLGHVDDLRQVAGDRIVVCAGLGARELAPDPAVEGVLGQVVVVEPGTIPTDLGFSDERGPAPIFYSIPRRGQVVLGGVSEPCTLDRPPPPDPAVTARILDGCRALGWEPGAVVRARTGLRPVRPEPRVERDADDPRVVHNYGHGGAGFTLALACAEDAADLVEA